MQFAKNKVYGTWYSQAITHLNTTISVKNKDFITFFLKTYPRLVFGSLGPQKNYFRPKKLKNKNFRTKNIKWGIP